MFCRFLAALHLNRLQRKVVLVVVVIILVPTMIAGVLSASWIAGRMDDSIERWIRESAQVNVNWLAQINNNGRLFADVLEHTGGGPPQFFPGRSPIPPRLLPLARELGINLVQVFDPDQRRIFSEPKATLEIVSRGDRVVRELGKQDSEQAIEEGGDIALQGQHPGVPDPAPGQGFNEAPLASAGVGSGHRSPLCPTRRMEPSYPL